MKYKLYNSDNNIKNVVGHILVNRGINEWEKYLNLDDTVIQSYSDLDNIDIAVKCCIKHIEANSNIGILVDEDVDGYSSAAMMYLYLKRTSPELNVKYIMHKKTKAHGLSDDVTIPDGTNLLIIPDASTNDTEECKKLKEKNVDIIILDHHEAEKDNPYSIIVNNQMSAKYRNKDLCGAGVVYRFLQALDDQLWQEYADDYLDLCALANISDVMDMRSFETKRLVQNGLSNISNKCFKAFLDAQSYSTKDVVNIHNIQWFITPIMNGMIRVGSFEEKELLFRAFIEQDEFFDYKTRGNKDKPSEIISEDIYTRAARLSKNAKSRQDKAKEKATETILSMASQAPQTDKVLMIDVTDELDAGMTGVVAIKIAEAYRKPCILLKKYHDVKVDKVVYGGSARNPNHSPVDSFKDIVNSNQSFNWGNGHANAFGVNIDVDKIDTAQVEFNSLLQDIVYDTTYRVDYIINANDINFGFMNELTTLDDIIGQGIDEPRLAIEGLQIRRGDIELFGKNEDTISFIINDIKFIQFKCKSGADLYDWIHSTWNDDDIIEINIVGTPTINDYQGLRTLQFTIAESMLVKIIEGENQECDSDTW